MNMIPTPVLAGPIVYPESDGLPMADNTKQFDWIVLLVTNLRALFRDSLNVFVGGNLFWYPVEGRPDIRVAPDGLVVFDRPKGHRRSYRQWEESNVPLTVAIEILSPGNTVPEMAKKLTFYEDYGVEEYYVYDPDQNELLVYRRRGAVLRLEPQAHGFVSPRLGIRFDLSGDEMVVQYPDGTPFMLLEDVEAARTAAELRAEAERQRADAERQRGDTERQRATRLAELGRKARRQQATEEELAELDRLEDSEPPT